ncbi:MAG: hypothetical protein LUE91_04445, partial [Oscillospiraceae bacterium]|nr:hypothetical protein [Oscillospiraceae bacterium]
ALLRLFLNQNLLPSALADLISTSLIVKTVSGTLLFRNVPKAVLFQTLGGLFIPSPISAPRTPG